MVSNSFKKRTLPITAAALAGLIGLATLVDWRHSEAAQPLREEKADGPVVTGKDLTPLGSQVNVGSFPANMALDPSGRYIVVTNTGYRQNLSVLSAADGHIVSQLAFGENTAKPRQGLYYGLAFRPGSPTTLCVSRGAEERVSTYTLGDEGKLSETDSINFPSDSPKGKSPNNIAGLAASQDGSRLYAANDHTDLYTRLKGRLLVQTRGVKSFQSVETPGFPFAVAAQGDDKVFVSSERDGVVSVIDTKALKLRKNLTTGDHPMALLFNKAQTRLYVANAGSDTVSVIDSTKDRVAQTLLVRPDDARGIPGATPTGLTLSPDEKTLYVTLGDMNAVAIVRLPEGKVAGYLPVGWYPTSCVASPDGKRLFVANAKGVTVRNPNAKAVGKWGKYIQNILEGTVSVVTLPDDDELPMLTSQVLANNRFHEIVSDPTDTPLAKAGIEHVVYIIKENRTYDQVMGDVKEGNGDPALCLFGKDVTPNLHALAERFVLLDNFYCCAEVSYDGWDWSVSGMGSEYTIRNAPYNYSGRGRNYDGEGDNNNVPADIAGVPDVARAPGGYIWDVVAKKGLTYRNYGFYLSFVGPGDRGPEGRPLVEDNHPNKKVLVGHTDVDFLQFDMTYADSDAWTKLDAACPKQRKSYGSHNSPSRFSEWKREFNEQVKSNAMPAFTMLRLPRDHTSGTTAGLHSPRAMVADNDYAVGQVVDAISHSPFWKKTAIFVLEDDAQNGNDHIDAHRSICYVISPMIAKGTVDHRFYNTDSVLHSMELCLGLPPMCQYDAVAAPFAFLAGPRTNDANDAPYDAILPAKSVVGEVNGAHAYRARQSAKLNFARADAVPDGLLNDLIWHSVKGAKTPVPPRRFNLQSVTKKADSDD